MAFLNPCLSILLVEDDEVDIQNVQRALALNSVTNTLYIANNGEEALSLLRSQATEAYRSSAPTIVLLDINMPKMNGLEFLQAIRNDPQFSHLLVFMLTSSDNDRDKCTAYNLNVAGYILKPLKSHDFVEKISGLVSYWKLLQFPK